MNGIALRASETNMSLKDFTDGYIEAALWSTNDEEGEPLDKNFGARDIDDETRRQMEIDCARFYEAHEQRWDALDGYQDGLDDARAGHDFWLNRNGHGTGFWDDDGLDESNQEFLSNASKKFGTFDLYLYSPDAAEDQDVDDDATILIGGSPLSDEARATAMAGLGTKTNAEGLTWAEWSAAAGTRSAEAKRAWEAGEDPSDWRASLRGRGRGMRGLGRHEQIPTHGATHRGDRPLPHQSLVTERDLTGEEILSHPGKHASGYMLTPEQVREGRFRPYLILVRSPESAALAWTAFETEDAFADWIDAYGLEVEGTVAPGQSFDVVLPHDDSNWLPLHGGGLGDTSLHDSTGFGGYERYGELDERQRLAVTRGGKTTETTWKTLVDHHRWSESTTREIAHDLDQSGEARHANMRIVALDAHGRPMNGALSGTGLGALGEGLAGGLGFWNPKR